MLSGVLQFPAARRGQIVWRRWKAGQTLHEIGRAFGKEHSSIRCLVARHDHFMSQFC
jgi:hypothetical protein